MKTTIAILLITVLSFNSAKSQTEVNITEDLAITAGQFSNQYSNYTINISKGATLTINMDVYLQNTTFNGGKVIVNNKLTFWSAGTFNKTEVVFNGTGSLVSSGELTIKNSDFTFANNSTAIIYTTVNMITSRMKFIDNSSMEATGGNFNLKNTSSLVAGDGKSKSTAFIKFNGATLNEYDNSFLTLANFNNYYFNWSNYNTLVNNKSVKTINNLLNCNILGKNNCASPNVYGPATLNYAGVSSSAVLPVKLTAFGVTENDNIVDISWTTAAEINAAYFEVERSIDGTNWIVVKNVKANGNSSETSLYNTKDLLKVGGKLQYRLKMADQDGTFSYSPVRTINAAGTIAMNVYPNPASSYVVINSKNGAADRLNIQLINLSGQVVKQVNGNGNTVLSVTEFNGGNYIVRVTNSENVSENFKLMIRK